MKRSVAAPVAAWFAFAILTSNALGALPLAHPGFTVNDYTAAQSERAVEAARRANFDSLEIVMVQDGNFFLNGQKQGGAYSITVTPEGKVYSSMAAPALKS